MQYIDLSTSFGQFDRDNMYRYEFAGYLNLAGSLLHDIETNPDHRKVAGLQSQAELISLLAVKQFKTWDYLPAASNARAAYELTLRAAASLGIDTSAAALGAAWPRQRASRTKATRSASRTTERRVLTTHAAGAATGRPRY